MNSAMCCPGVVMAAGAIQFVLPCSNMFDATLLGSNMSTQETV